MQKIDKSFLNKLFYGACMIKYKKKLHLFTTREYNSIFKIYLQYNVSFNKIKHKDKLDNCYLNKGPLKIQFRQDIFRAIHVS